MQRLAVDVAVSTIVAGKFRRYAHLTKLQHLTVPGVVWHNFIDVFKVVIGFFQSIVLLMRFRPDVVLAKGGYVCLPLGLAARFLRLPLVIHDSDMRPGLTNRVLSRYATVIATGSPLKNYPYDRSRSHYIGVPISDTFRPVSSGQQERYKSEIGVDESTPLVVVTGGGLGARSINTAMIKIAQSLSRQGIAVYHVTGVSHFEEVERQVRGIKLYQTVPFVYEDMHHILGAADVVVSRASATFLQELAGLGKPVIAVPSRQLGDQLKNAEVYKEADAAVVMTDDQINGGNELENTILTLVKDDTYRKSLGVALHGFARPNAAKDLAKLVETAAKKA